MPQEYIELQQFPREDDEPRNESKSSLGFSLSHEEIITILARMGQPTSYESLDDLPRSAQFMIEKIEGLKIEDAIVILRDTLAEHTGDVNFPSADYHLIERLLAHLPKKSQSDSDISGETKMDSSISDKTYDTWALEVRLEAALVAFHSPYPEVRAVVDPYDDHTIPAETLRVYVIGLSWTLVGSLINNFFVHRLPSITLSSSTVQLLLLPSGRLWEKAFAPNKKIKILGRYFDINPGPWNYKEMMLATIIYSCSAGTPYSIYNFFVMKLDRFYGLEWVSWTYQVMFALSTQFLGFAFAFLMLKVCVYPKKAMWPTLLPTIALNRALMNEDPPTNINGWKISRYSFFFVVFMASFCYNWLPSYLFKALSTFNWPTWFSPNSIHLVNITGTNQGLGLNPLPSLDWNIIDMAGCLTIPFYTYANQYIGMLLGFVTILMVYYSNNKWTSYFPINSNRLFNNKGEVYNVKKILNENKSFDHKKYMEYGPPYFAAANLVLYGAYFCMYPFAILYHTVTEWSSMKQSFANIWLTLKDAFQKDHDSNYRRFGTDPHCQMMSHYKEVPSWWFVTILIVSVSFALICVIFYPVETPVWGIFFTIGINFLFLIPITAIASVTGFTFGLNVLVELIVGYAIPNSGIALITLKAYGYNIDSQASNYITDQKLAHYTKIPPRAIFRGQIISTFLSVFVALFIANWQMDNIPDICELHQKNRLRCPGANTYFFSSIQYGEIGPAKVFGGIYPVLKWCFLLGAVMVIPMALFKKIGPRNITRSFQPTIILGGFLSYAPYNLSYFTMGLYLSFIFMNRIKRTYTIWWEKYNYILTSALSAGVAFSALLIFFTVQYNKDELDWWGNRLSNMGIEGSNKHHTWLKASDAPEGYIGLRKDQFP
ncbi:OPT_family_small_oligopeptide_transporter [Candidozyma auris]|uniref:OPT_family_small_oligopeptide_transporter n=1 Tax=Candidozyma auris TaxID=498019 RepID=UPI000D2C5679|nr:OPT_family_small_oligopeptide_transporter [[Candida] auris]QEO22276.1 OPT_family_small_oligopeptide_transporter [[Candida] auris]GBL51314.1 small oligopeptide transporter [[Candida] auris]